LAGGSAIAGRCPLPFDVASRWLGMRTTKQLVPPLSKKPLTANGSIAPGVNPP
jgi:hypothetical protein